MTGAADKTVRLWEVETGKQLFEWEHLTTIRSVNLSAGDHRFVAVSDAEMKQLSTLHVYELKQDLSERTWWVV